MNHNFIQKSKAACVAVMLVSLFGDVSTAFAKSRSCDGRLEIKNKKTGQVIKLEEFTASDSCTIANRCRERASDRAIDCMSRHWATRWDGVRPAQCASQNNVSGYDLTDLKASLEGAVCSAGWVGGSTVEVQLSATVGGDKKCGQGRVLTDKYEVKSEMCQRLSPTPGATRRSVSASAISDAVNALLGKLELRLHNLGERNGDS